MNFYESLNLTPSATTEEIEEAYRTLARKVHPDLNRHDPTPAEARMKLLNRIRETLTDPDHRAKYDRELAEGADTARVESAINQTLRESRDDVLFWRRVKLTTLAGLALGLLLGLGSWLFDLFQRREPEPSPVPAALPVEKPIQAVAPSVPKAAPAAPPVKKKKGPEVVEFGSSTEQVLHLMGRPDQVEELAAQGIRVLHYGRLRLVFKNNKLIPGSGIQKEPQMPSAN
ncbi:MAG TPA: DnaJ domain-containing protein [Terriglobia bacterium]|nr:DnaJ domain-containing protein [Terriglobia bacterium]